MIVCYNIRSQRTRAASGRLMREDRTEVSEGRNETWATETEKPTVHTWQQLRLHASPVQNSKLMQLEL